MKMKLAVAMTGLTSALWFAGILHAGLRDSAPPLINGVLSRVVYRLGPIYFHAGQTDTVVKCTNHDDISASVAVELFNEQDQLVGALATGEVAAEGTIAFSTSAFSGNANLVVIGGVPELNHGKARVSASTTRLACSAYHRVLSADGTVNEDEVSLVKYVALTTQP